MPIFIASLLGGLINIIGTLAGRVLVALGIGVVTYTGISTTLEWLKSQAIASITSLPSEVVSLMAFMKVGVAINIVFSAIVVRAALSGLNSDTLKKWVMK